MTRNTETQTHFIEFEADVNSWKQGPPGVRTARPPRCVVCEAPCIEPSGKVVLHGQGLRERTLLGPLDAEGEPRVCGLLLRRYECQRCKAVLTVGPRGLLPHRRYSAEVIALAFWLWAVRQLTDAMVRQRLSEALTVRTSRKVRTDGTMSVGGLDWELEQGWLSSKKVTVARSFADPSLAPWIEHEGRRLPLQLVDPVANSRRGRPTKRARKGVDAVDFHPNRVRVDVMLGRLPKRGGR